jgi:hypothetical protein
VSGRLSSLITRAEHSSRPGQSGHEAGCADGLPAEWGETSLPPRADAGASST